MGMTVYPEYKHRHGGWCKGEVQDGIGEAGTGRRLGRYQEALM